MAKKETAIDRIKKLHQAQAIERKDISLKDLVARDSKDGMIKLQIKGFASKFVEKYANQDNKGYHTMVYLADGTKTGAFSNALYEFANFFYNGAGLEPSSLFKKIDFAEGFIEANVTVVKLDGNKSTYNFEILDGEIGKCELMTDGNSGNTLMLEGEIQ